MHRIFLIIVYIDLQKMHNKKKILYFYIFIFFYLTLLIGYYFGENSSGGSKYDFGIHLKTVELFNKDFYHTLLNYDSPVIGNSHSPIFIIFLSWLLSFGEGLGKFIYLNLCALIPFIFYFSLKEKFKLNNSIIIFFLSCFFYFSPYFRSYAIWPGDENISILFFLFSIFYYLKIMNNNYKNEKELNFYIVLNVIFLALASYFRPIYSLFSILFFTEMVLIKFNFRKFFLYVIFSIILSLPAIYYVFFLNINFFSSYLGDSINLSNSLGLSYTVFLFYSLPFIYLSRKNISFKFNQLNIFSAAIYSLILYIFFDYKINSGGGVFYQIYKLFFYSNEFFWMVCAISFLIFNKFINYRAIKNWIILAILIIFEIDKYFYLDTYDPLFLICLFLLIDTKLTASFINEISFKKVGILFFYLLFFWIIKCINYYFI